MQLQGKTALVTGFPLYHLNRIASNGKCTMQTKAHVWLVWSLLLRPGVVKDCLGLLTYGRFTRNSGPQHAGGKPTHWAASRGRAFRYYPRKNASANKGGRGRKNPVAPVPVSLPQSATGQTAQTADGTDCAGGGTVAGSPP